MCDCCNEIKNLMNAHSPLSILETVRLLRAKAAELNDTADRLEAVMRDFGITKDGVLDSAGPSSQVSYADIVDVLRKKGAGRPKEIARKLGTTKEKVLKIVQTNDQAFAITGKGWISLSHHMNGHG